MSAADPPQNSEIIAVSGTAEHLQALHEFRDRLEGIHQEQRLYAVALRLLVDQFKAREGYVALYHAPTDSIRIAFRTRGNIAPDSTLARAFIRYEHPTLPPGWLMVTLRCREKTVGAVALYRPDGWTPEQRPALLQFCARLSAAIPRVRERQIEDTIRRIASLIVRDRRPTDVFYHVLDALHQMLRYDHNAALLTVDAETGELVVRAEKVTWAKQKSEHIGRRIPLTTALREQLQYPWILAVRKSDGTWSAPVDMAKRLAYHERPPEQTLLCIPLRERDRLLGLLKVSAVLPNAFDADDAEDARRLSELAAAAIHAFGERAELQGRLDALLDVGNHIASNLQTRRILDAIARQLVATLGYDACCFRLLDGDGVLCTQSSAGVPAGHPLLASRRLSEAESQDPVTGPTGLVSQAFATGQVAERRRSDAPEAQEWGASMAAPIRVDGRLIGVIDCYRRADSAFGEEEIRFVAIFANQVALALRNAESFERLQRLNHELTETHRALMAVGRQIQTTLLPHHAPNIVGYEMDCCSEPAQEVGGDFYQFIPLGDGRWAIALGDVSGKGVPSALYMGVASTMLEALASPELSPVQMLTLLNDRLHAKFAGTRYFVTLLYGILDPRTATFHMSNAGHVAPLWITGLGQAEYVKLRGLPLGMRPDPVYTERLIHLEVGNTLILSSDGFLDTGPYLDGTPGGYRWLRDQGLRLAGLPAATLRQRLFAAAASASPELQDDRSLIVLRRHL